MNIEPHGTAKTPTIGKVLAWISIVVGIATALTPLLPVDPLRNSNSTILLIYFVLLGLASAIAGVGALRSSSFAFYVLWYVYAVQLFEYASDSLAFSFMSPYSIVFAFGDYDPPSRIGINVPAMAACFVALYSARFLAAHSRATTAVTDG